MNRQEFEEFKGHYLTVKFFNFLKKRRAQLLEENSEAAGNTLEQVAMRHIEITSEARALLEVIELTKEQMEQ